MLSSSSARNSCCSCPRLCWCACVNRLASTTLAKQGPKEEISVSHICNFALCGAAQVRASNQGSRRSLRDSGCIDVFGIKFNCDDRGRHDEDDWRRQERGAASCATLQEYTCVISALDMFCRVWSAPQGHHKVPRDMSVQKALDNTFVSVNFAEALCVVTWVCCAARGGNWRRSDWRGGGGGDRGEEPR